MLYRVTSILLALVLCFSVLPFRNSGVAKTKATTRPQASALQLSQTRVDLPDGGGMLNLTGQYQVGAQRVNLRSVTIASNLNLNGGGTIGSNPSSPNSVEPVEEDYRPEEDYYYSYSDMSRSDGTPLVQATYEYQQATDRNMLYITISGVTLTFNLTTEEASEMTEAEEARLQAWATSEDGLLVQNTSIAIIEQGPDQADAPLLLNYYAVAMLVDMNPPSESALKMKNKESKAAHHVVRSVVRLETKTNSPSSKPCSAPSIFSSSSNASASKRS